MMINRKLEGWMGRTHALLSINILLLCLILRLPIVTEMLSSVAFFIFTFVIFVGATLLVDLDADASTSGYVLGPVGLACTAFMKSTSALTWNIYHLKNDYRPENQHRFLWHSPLFLTICFSLLYYTMADKETSLIKFIKEEKSHILHNYVSLVIFLIIVFMAVLVGSSMIVKLLNRFISVPTFISDILPLACVLYACTLTLSQLKLACLFFAFGFILHPLEDYFADHGIPLLFPIPIIWQKKAWKKFRFPFAITTGSIANTFVDIIATVLVFVQAIFLIIRR